MGSHTKTPLSARGGPRKGRNPKGARTPGGTEPGPPPGAPDGGPRGAGAANAAAGGVVAGGTVAGGVTSILDSFRRIIRTLRVASRATEKEFGLSAAQLFVLHALADAPALSLNEVAERTRTHQSSVSVVVQRLVERGLVARDPVPGDARRMALSLTPAARQLIVDAPDAPSERLISALERTTPTARTRLATTLARLVAELGADEGPVTMLFEEDSVAAADERQKAARVTGKGPPKSDAGASSV
jgi:DNA-binding MarR family transcriptional regulator